MRQLSAFLFTSLNGYYKDENDSMEWHQHGGEEEAFSQEGLSSESILVFGRKTYQLMESFWPTSMAAQQMPEVAAGMNRSEKIVFSKTLHSANWENTTLIKEGMIEFIRGMKSGTGKDMTILGSGEVVSQLMDAGLIDVLQIMVDPITLPKGTSVFFGTTKRHTLNLVSSRTFKSGVVLNTYHPKISHQ